MNIAHGETRLAEHVARARAGRTGTHIRHASGIRASHTERRNVRSTSPEYEQNVLTRVLDTRQECVPHCLAPRAAKRAEHIARIHADRSEARVKHASGKCASHTEERGVQSTPPEYAQSVLTLVLDARQECVQRPQRGESCGARHRSAR